MSITQTLPQIKPDDVFTLNAVATLLARNERFEEALRHAQHLVRIAGRIPQAHFTLARVAAAAGDSELAREQCDLALQIDPNFEPARLLMQSLPADQ